MSKGSLGEYCPKKKKLLKNRGLEGLLDRLSTGRRRWKNTLGTEMRGQGFYKVFNEKGPWVLEKKNPSVHKGVRFTHSPYSLGFMSYH